MNLGLIFGAAGTSAIFAKETGFKTIYNLESREEEFLLTFKKNFPEATAYHVHPDEIELFMNDEIENLSKADVVFGQPDCKAFSTLAIRKKDRFEFMKLKDEQFVWFFKIIKRVNPKMFILENLPRSFLKFQLVEDTLMIDTEVLVDKLPYHFTFSKLNAISFGAPQNRTRMFLVGQRKDIIGRFRFNQPSNLPFVYGDSFLWSAIKDIPKEVPNQLKAMHTFERETRFAKLEFGKSYYGSQNNCRLFPNKPSPTITSSKTQYVHPYEARTLTPRECARIMGIPDTFVFEGGRTSQLDQVGKAVVPQVAKEILRQVKSFLEEFASNKV